MRLPIVFGYCTKLLPLYSPFFSTRRSMHVFEQLIDFFSRSLRAQRIVLCSTLLLQRIDRAVPNELSGSPTLSTKEGLVWTTEGFSTRAGIAVSKPTRATIQIVRSVPSNFHFDLNFNCSNTLFIYCSLVLQPLLLQERGRRTKVILSFLFSRPIPPTAVK